MYVVITKQLPSFQNCFGVLSRSLQGDPCKDVFTFQLLPWTAKHGVASNMLPATPCLASLFYSILRSHRQVTFNPLNAELNPICHLLALLGTHHILHVSRIRVKERYLSNCYGGPLKWVLRLGGERHLGIHRKFKNPENFVFPGY